MRRYETIIIADPDLGEDGRNQVFDKIKEIIKAEGGFLAEFDEWGAKKLAYEIKKKTRGYYVRMDLCGTGDLISEMERNFRLDDKVLKFMTILLEETADIEAIKAEIAEKTTAKETETSEPEKTEDKAEVKAEEKAEVKAEEKAVEPEASETEIADTASKEEE